MRRVTVSSSRPDCLEVRVGRDRARLAFWSTVGVALVALRVWIPGDGAAGLNLTLGLMAVLPVLGVALWRFSRVSQRTLVRLNGRLLLDGEPLELARVELRMLKMPITRVPTGYALSLWVMTASGPEDVPIGHSRTLLEASTLSGQLEEFVQRSSVKQHRHV